MKKVDAVDAGPKGASDDTPAANNAMGEVTPTGTAQPFIAKEGLQKTPEEEIKTRPSGCGCSLPGGGDAGGLLWLAPLACLGALARRRLGARARART